MKTFSLLICLITLSFLCGAQQLPPKLESALQQLQKDSQTTHALISLYVVNSKTGAVVYDKNGDIGMAAASSQKVITSTAAFELLGHDYAYKTEFGYSGAISKGALSGNLILKGSGDPSLGSWRYATTKEDTVLNKWVSVVKAAGIHSINGNIKLITENWETQTIPDGWTWTDIGNYYGAGAGIANWRENQYDLVIKPGKNEGDAATVIRTRPFLHEVELVSELTTGKKGSGDNSVIYLPPQSTLGVVRGTVPLGVDSFVVSGSFPDAQTQLVHTIEDALKKNRVMVTKPNALVKADQTVVGFKPLATYVSPSLDSLNYWFLKRSINLYGEALLKTMGREKSGYGSTDSGLAVVKRFWKEHGIDPTAINMIDGSGLSPQNRITTKALVSVMQYAKDKAWFNSFYTALPEINDLKMKSGSIGGARSFTGYVSSKDGNEYTFAIIINGYTGSSLSIVRKLYSVLDLLK